ncbi:restriction endonuclease subunit S [Sulfurimonas diazotrophicus]|uniref:Restriction endonuclease subunit S n=1 Tax=Sulfurimonas diazotrophicus TaxID=3131939 RepID=A0ABZ3HDI7_9BACT
MTAVSKVPKLRFPEFSDEWHENFIGELYTNLKTGSTPSRLVKDYFQGNNLWITSGELNFGHINDTIEKISDQAIKDTNLRLYPVGTFFIAITGLEAPGTRGKCAINDIPATTNQSCMAFYETDEIHTKFLFYWYLKYGIPLYYKYAQGTKQQSFNNTIVEKFVLHYPSKPEQQKIASFLNAVDTKIEKLTKKQELLEQYKKGGMQKIFSQEIRFRADDKSEFPEWKEKLFGEIYSFINTNSFSRALMNDVQGRVKNIHYGDIHTKYRSNFHINKENVPFLNDDIEISKIKDEQYCQVKDLVIADASEDYKDIGKTIELIDLQNEKLLAGLHTYIARDKNDVMALGFASYLMQTNNIRNQIMKSATGISVLGISKNNLSNVKFLLPSKEEQTKIADFLSAIDTKIDLVSKELQNAKQFKKALLQQMFI